MAGFTSEEVLVVGTAERPHARVNFSLDPASGALEISSDLRLKARKALKAEVRRMKLRLYVELARLYLVKLALECACAMKRGVRNLGRYLGYLLLAR